MGSDYKSLSPLSIQEFIAGLVRGKRVLDVGCADHDASTEAAHTWLHKHIRASASYVLGIDLLEQEVQRLRAKGYNVRQGDVLTLTLDENFEVVTAGEIIEHVEDPGNFIRNMARHLGSEGQVIITTPHVFFLLHFIEAILMNPRQRWNPEHVAWFDAFTLRNLLERCGLQIVDVRYFARSRKTRAVLRAFRIQACPKFLASTILVVAQPARGK